MDMRLQRLHRFIASKSAAVAAAAVCYFTIVMLLLYGLVLHVRLEPRLQPITPVSAAPAPVRPDAVDACAGTIHVERELCNAEMKIDTARARLKQNRAAWRAQNARPSRQTLVWAPDPAHVAMRAQAQFQDWAMPEIKSQQNGRAAEP